MQNNVLFTTQPCWHNDVRYLAEREFERRLERLEAEVAELKIIVAQHSEQIDKLQKAVGA